MVRSRPSFLSAGTKNPTRSCIGSSSGSSNHHHNCAAASTSMTALSMGVFEDFMSGQDDSARKKENDAYLAELQKRVDNINALEAEIEELGDDELEAKTAEFRRRLASGEDINGKLLEEAFAVVREAAW